MKELGGIIKWEGGPDAFHDSGKNLSSTTNELRSVDSEAKVAARVCAVTLFKVFFKGGEVGEEGVVGVVIVLLREVGQVKRFGDGERSREFSEVLLEEGGK
jgi:hypothetical protein